MANNPHCGIIILPIFNGDVYKFNIVVITPIIINNIML